MRDNNQIIICVKIANKEVVVRSLQSLYRKIFTGIVCAAAAFFLPVGLAMAAYSVSSVSVGSQTGTATYGTATTITFQTTVTIAGTSGAKPSVTLSATPTISGVTYAWYDSTNTAAVTWPISLNATTTYTLRATTNTTAAATTGTTITVTDSGSAKSGTGTLTINQASSTTTVGATTPINLGQSATFTASVTPSTATGTIQFKVDGANVGSPVTVTSGSATSAPVSGLAAGNHTVTAVYSGDTNFATSTSAGVTQVVNSVTATTTTVSTPVAITYGQNASFTATVSPSAATGTVQFKIDGVNQGSPVTLSGGTATLSNVTGLSVGNRSVTAVYNGDATYATSTSSAVTQVVNKATPTVTVWPTASAITYGQTLTSSTLSGGSASTAGTFTWTTPSTAPNTGTSSQGVTFTPTDSTNYTTTTGTVSVTVNKATPTVTVWPTAPAITYGQTLASSILTGGSASTAGTFAWTNSSTAPNAGTASQGVTFTPTDTTNYTTTSGSVSITVNKATPTVTTWPTASAITYGQTLSSSTLTGGTASVLGSFAFTSPATAPNAGTALQGVTFTPTDATNYNTVAGTTSVTVNKATPTVTVWPTASAITYGQTLTSSTLTGGTPSTPGTFAFTTPTTAPNAGTASQSVTFTPTDTVNYNNATGTVSITVNMATPTVTVWPTASAITYGQTLTSSTLTGGTASTAGSFAFTTPTTAPNAGIASQGVTFTPTDTLNYNIATGTVSVTVNKADPVVTLWPTASAITYGQTLASSILSGGTVTPTGTFAFTTPTTAPNAGTALQGVIFTPTDAINYNTATGTASVTVNMASQTITFGALGSKVYGDPSFTLTATGGASGNAVTFVSSNLAVATVTGNTVTIVGVGITSITASQAGNTNYNAAVDVVQPFTVDKATPSVSIWPTASAITYGQALSLSTLTGGTASVAGSFAFTTPTTIPGGGTALQGVTFTPTDAAHYYTVAGTVSVTVNKADQIITFSALPSKNVGDADFAPGATATSGLTVTYASDNIAVATIVANQIHIVAAGTANITASQSGDTNYNAAAPVIQALTVNVASTPTLKVTINGNGSVNSTPNGLSCTSGICSDSTHFTNGQSVSLQALASYNYDFTGWSGACSGTVNPCSVTVSGLTEVTATFTGQQLVKNGTSYYPSMQEAYNAALEGAILQGRIQTFTENLDFNKSVNVAFNGGYDATWAVTGYTTINGSVTMTGGSVTISNVIIQ
jgi:hypothetical protein